MQPKIKKINKEKKNDDAEPQPHDGHESRAIFDHDAHARDQH